MSGPQLVVVTDPADDRLADYVRLRETSLRRHLESERGLFIAEGEKVIRRAVEAGHRPRSFLLAERWLDSLADVLAAHPDVPVFVVSEAVAEEVTGFHVHRGALASLHRGPEHDVAGLLATAHRLVICEDIVDHTNVGALVRNAAGLGWDGVLLSPRCADPLYRRSIKVSMGTVFSLPWARLDDWSGALPMVAAAGFTVVALALNDRAESLDAVQAELAAVDRLAVVLGTEGAGLSQRWLDGADRVVRIDMARGIDSLNVAATAAISCHALARRVAAEPPAEPNSTA